MLEAVEFLGVSDAFFGMSELEMQQELLAIQSSLEQKGYAETDFDGNFTLTNEIRNAINICANCDTFIVVENTEQIGMSSRKLFYVKDSSIIQLCESNKNTEIIPIASFDELNKLIIEDIIWKCTITQFTGMVTILNSIIEKIKCSLGGFDPSEGNELLKINGCNNQLADTICRGLSSGKNFIGISVTVFIGDEPGVKNALFINDENCIIKMIQLGLYGEEQIKFETVSSAQAKNIITETLLCAFQKNELINQITAEEFI